MVCAVYSEAPPPRHYGTQFLNVTTEDVALSTNERMPMELVSKPVIRGPGKGLTLHHAHLDQDANLLSYCMTLDADSSHAEHVTLTTWQTCTTYPP